MKIAVPALVFAFAATTALAASAPAETFDDRMRLAADAEARDEFKAYQPAMIKRAGKHLARTMRRCSRAAPKPAKPFALVADISAAGKPEAVEVSPQTKFSLCFASGFSAVSYPKPPAYPERQGFPVMMKIRIER